MNIAKMIPFLILLILVSCSGQAEIVVTDTPPTYTSTTQPTPTIEPTAEPDYSNLRFFLDDNIGWLLQPVDPAGTGKAEVSLKKTSDGGQNWEVVLDPVNDAGTLQSFTTTGLAFADENYGWVTQDSKGIQVLVYLQVTNDGGLTWNGIEMPAPKDFPKIFMNCACGLYDPVLESTQGGSVRMSCNCLGDDNYPVKDFLYSSTNGGSTWIIYELP
jgi:hypothetical protein